jgi:hypothetical protein
MNNTTTEAAIAQSELSECTMGFADHVPQELVTIHQEKFAPQFVPTEPSGPTRIRNVYVPQTASMSQVSALNAHQENCSTQPSKDANQSVTSDSFMISELTDVDRNAQHSKLSHTI